MCDCERLDRWQRLKAKYESEIEEATLEIELGFSYAILNLQDRKMRLEKVNIEMAKLRPCENNCEYRREKCDYQKQEMQNLSNELKDVGIISDSLTPLSNRAEMVDVRIQTLEDRISAIEQNLKEVNAIIYDPAE